MIILREQFYTSNRDLKKKALKEGKKFVDVCMNGKATAGDKAAMKAVQNYTETFSPYISSSITGQPYPKYLENAQKKVQKYGIKKARKSGITVKSSDVD